MAGDQNSDGQLVREILAGSSDASAVLFNRHWDVAYEAALSVIGRRAQAEDAASDAFIAALGALGSFDQDRPFRPWLRRIAVNKALDLLRAERLSAPVTDATPELDWAESGSPHEDLLGHVAALGDERRVVLVLRYWLDFEPMEIARMLQIPVGTVHSRLGRARAELRKSLEVPR
ncbi:MAG: RNA polymerase sigma factor [Thermoleophilia bacterium]